MKAKAKYLHVHNKIKWETKQNLIEKTYSWNAVLQLWLVRARVSTCQGPLRENEHC